GWAAAGFVLLVIQAGLSVAALALIKLVIDSVATGVLEPDRAAANQRTAVLIGLAAGVALVSAFCRSLESTVGELQRDLISDHVHGLVHEKLVQSDVAYFEKAEHYNALYRVQAEAPQRTATILTSLLQVGRSGVSLAAIAGLLLPLNWWVALILLIGDL